MFKTYKVTTTEELLNTINGLDNSFKYILHISCPYEIKDNVKNSLDLYVKDQRLLKYKLTVTTESKQINTESKQINTEIETNVDVEKSFKEFLDIIDLKFPKDKYLSILQ